MSEPARALRIGDRVQYEGQPWQLVAVSGVWLTLRGTAMRCCAVLLVTQLVGAADFSLPGRRRAGGSGGVGSGCFGAGGTGTVAAARDRDRDEAA